MKRPVLKNENCMVLDGVFSSEAVDSSGEVVKLDGMDISSMEEGEALANYEHKSKESGGNGAELVGRIIYVKKIFDKEDCEDSRQEFYYAKVGEVPYLYGMVRLLDAAGHPGAAALAAQVRDAVKHDEKILVRYSVEGSTLERDKNVIKTSIARQVAITVKPCNKTCNSGIVVDPAAPEGYDKNPQEVLKAEVMGVGAKYIGKNPELECNPVVNDPGRSVLDDLVENLKLLKSITAGSYDAAPSTLTGGAALQKESLGKKYKRHIVKAIQDYKKPFNKQEFKTYLKTELEKADLPPVSDSFLDHFVNMAENFQIRKSIQPIKLLDTDDRLLKTVNELECMLIDLRKSLRDTLQSYSLPLPEVYQVQIRVGSQLCPAGRFMIANNQVYHLEDYHNILNSFAPVGPVSQELFNNLQILQNSGNFVISESQAPETPSPSITVTQQPVPPRPSIFEYHRPGLEQPHILEFANGLAALDGEALTPDELSLILENANTGLASIRFKSELIKTEEMDIKGAMQALRQLVAQGHAPPDLERVLTRHIYHDPMVADVGNKHAWNEFQAENRPGVYGSIDMNSFKNINDTYGHSTGDEAIKAVGGALREAANKTGRVKLFRAGGDEFAVHAENPEDAHTFIRHARSHVDSLPPIKGVHRPSFSIGLGHNFETADTALREAKKNKIDPVSQKPLYHPAKTPHFGHSMLPGSEGPINLGGSSEIKTSTK